MADNTSQTGADTIATDDLATINGGAVGAAVKVQRVKVGYGADGDFRDVDGTTYPLPIRPPNLETTGTLTAAGQTVTHTVPGGHGAFTVALSGTFSTGTTVVVECSEDGTNWFGTNVRQNLAAGLNETYSLISTDITGGSVGNPSIWKGNCAGVLAVRVRCSVFTAADSVSVRILSSQGAGGTFVLGGLMEVRSPVLSSTSGAIAAAGTGTVGPLDASRAGNVSFVVKNTVAASAWAGAPVIVFEQSDDNVSWAPLVVVRNDNGNAASTHTLPANTASASMVFEAPVEAVNYVRARVTTGPTTNGLTINIQAGTLAFSPVVTNVDRKDADRTAVNIYVSNVTAGATATEAIQTMTISKGTAATTTGTTYAIAANKRLRITGIRFSHQGHATATTATVIWRFRINTGGAAVVTSTPITIASKTATPATSLARDVYDVPIGEGYEIANTTGTVNFAITATPTFVTNAPTYDVHLVGYEY